MRNPRKYAVLFFMTLCLAALLGVNCVREHARLSATATWQHEDYVQAGATLYAQNCMICHGPHGEGVVGMPLRRTDLQGDPTAKADVYKMLYNTIYNGRPGNKAHPQWVKVDDGSGPGHQHYMSYTAMPAWGQSAGGPLDENKVQALATFIMNGDWNMLDHADKYPPNPANYNGLLPTSEASADVNASAKALLQDRSKSMCLSCHAIGSVGAHIGPDLSNVGSWGVDEAFLKDWIRHPNATPGPAMAHDLRMPIYWSANRPTETPNPSLVPTGDKATAVVSNGPYYMPAVKLTDDQLNTLVTYLMGLKAPDDPASKYYKK